MNMTVIETETYNAVKSACRKYVSNEDKKDNIDWEARKYELSRRLFFHLLDEKADESFANYAAKEAICLAEIFINKYKDSL